MNNKIKSPQVTKPLVMSSATKRKLANVAKIFKGKEMFPEKLERAKVLFQGLKELPRYAS